MDFVNKAFTQVADVFRSMTPGARFTSALLLIAIVTSIGYLFRHQTNGAEVFLFSGEQFSQRELGAMSAAFSKAGLNQWVEIGDTIKVPRSQRHLYIQALSENGALPDHSSKKMDDNLSRSSPWESKTMQDRKFLFSREQDLSFLVENIQGIDQATVQLQEVEKGGFRSAKERRALVAVRCDGNKTLTEDQVRSIRLMVSQGGGAEPEHVTVTDMNANKTYQGRKENDLANPDDNMYAQTKRMFEQAWESNILKQLSMIPGVIVGVNVELDPDINNQINTLKFDEKPSAVEIKTFSKESTGAGGETGGRAGAVSNGVVGNTGRAVTADSKTASTNTETREDQKYMPGRTQTAIQKAP